MRRKMNDNYDSNDISINNKNEVTNPLHQGI